MRSDRMFWKNLAVGLFITSAVFGDYFDPTPVYHKEMLGKQLTEHLTQDFYETSKTLTVRLSDNSLWSVMPLTPLGPTICDSIQGAEYDEIDKRFHTRSLHWLKDIRPIQVYPLSYMDSQAARVLEEFPPAGVYKATHILYDPITEQMVFARQIDREPNLFPSFYCVRPAYHNKMTFNQVIGYDKAKNAALKFSFLRPYPKHLVIRGAAGCGKKMLAKAIANKSKRTYIEVDLRQVFEQGWENQNFPSLAPMLNQDRGAIVAFTNFPDHLMENDNMFDLRQLPRKMISLRPTFLDWIISQVEEMHTYLGHTSILLLGPADFPQQIDHWHTIYLNLPDNQERAALLNHYSKGIQFEADCSSMGLAEMTEGFSPKQIQNLFECVKGQGVVSEEMLSDATTRVGELRVEYHDHFPAMSVIEKSEGSLIDEMIGYDTVKQKLTKIAETIQDPKPYVDLGAEPPHTLLITGANGVGKTTAVKALANAAGRALIHIDAAQVFEEIFQEEVDLSTLFGIAQSKGPSIICIDNFDHYTKDKQFLQFDYMKRYDIFSNRLGREISENDNTFLVLIASDKESVHQDILKQMDKGYKIHMSSPKPNERFEMLKAFAQAYVCDETLDFEQIAAMTQGLTPLDLKNLLLFAAQNAAEKADESIHEDALYDALKTLTHAKVEASQSSDSAAKIFDPFAKKTTFGDVGGCTEAKEDLSEVIAFLKNRDLYKTLGVRSPKGVLLTGAPGCGKTLLARAVAGEAGCNFFYCSGSDMNSKWMHEGARRIREIFENARENAPAVLFIDELDSVGSKRLENSQAAAADHNNSVNQLLVELDGFTQNDEIVVIAATNRPDLLDEALMRPGRFDRRVDVGLPALKDREEILAVHAKNRSFEEGLDLEKIAKMTIGMSGAQIEQMLNESAMIAGKNHSNVIAMVDIQNARDRVQMGREKASLTLTDEEKRNTAYHEAGHTIVGYLLECSDIVDKVTILPRARALGVTFFVPRGERTSVYKKQLKNDLAMALAGHAAESLFLDDVSTGATSDIERANQIARHMVCECGMSEKLGFLSMSKNLSSTTKRLIDEEIREMLGDAFKTAKGLLLENREKVKLIVEGLLEKETLYRTDLDEIMKCDVSV